MLLQHEAQHNETILIIRQLLIADKYPRTIGEEQLKVRSSYSLASSHEAIPQQGVIFIPAGSFLMGSNDYARTLDNERPSYEVPVATFVIDQTPVSNEDFLRFMYAGGYYTPAWWNPEGWRWRTHYGIDCPLYWRPLLDEAWGEVTQTGVHPLAQRQPVQGVSWYEADAYARFMGKRLPTEAEWEKAAASGLLQETGNVWEWTSTWFAPYPGFSAHPYEGYSTPYFDDQHRVLRGGSWATRPHVQRITFRNWYHPWVREIFAGVRCAQDA
jgi:ergothioneine biosynthesis protein EgtB